MEARIPGFAVCFLMAAVAANRVFTHLLEHLTCQSLNPIVAAKQGRTNDHMTLQHCPARPPGLRGSIGDAKRQYSRQGQCLQDDISSTAGVAGGGAFRCVPQCVWRLQRIHSIIVHL